MKCLVLTKSSPVVSGTQYLPIKDIGWLSPNESGGTKVYLKGSHGYFFTIRSPTHVVAKALGWEVVVNADNLAAPLPSEPGSGSTPPDSGVPYPAPRYCVVVDESKGGLRQWLIKLLQS